MNYNSVFQTEQLKTFNQVYLLFRLILNMKNRSLINQRNFLYFLRIISKITFCMAMTINNRNVIPAGIRRRFDVEIWLKIG